MAVYYVKASYLAEAFPWHGAFLMPIRFTQTTQ